MEKYNHSEIEYRRLEQVRPFIQKPLWEDAAPQDLRINYGFDAMNMTALFGQRDDVQWDEDQIYGFYLMLGRIWEIAQMCVNEDMTQAEEDLTELFDEIERLAGEKHPRHNAVIAVLMRLSHRIRHLHHVQHGISKTVMRRYLYALKPYAPCLCADLWDLEGNIFTFPKERMTAAHRAVESISLMINGRYCGHIRVFADATQEEALQAFSARKMPPRGHILRVIYQPHRVLSLIFSENTPKQVQKGELS